MSLEKFQTVYNVEIVFTREVLGATPQNKEVYAKYIQAKARELNVDEDTLQDEVEMVRDLEEKGWTSFLRDQDGKVGEQAYVIKGFFKGACKALRRVKKTRSCGVKVYKKQISELLHVMPDFLVYDLPSGCNGEDLEVCERALRAWSGKGEIVTLARSDVLPAGTKLSFQIHVFGDVITEDVLREWLDFGAWLGMRQWRNAGYGRFDYVLKKE